jgi:hypothetical protein
VDSYGKVVQDTSLLVVFEEAPQTLRPGDTFELHVDMTAVLNQTEYHYHCSAGGTPGASATQASGNHGGATVTPVSGAGTQIQADVLCTQPVTVRPGGESAMTCSLCVSDWDANGPNVWISFPGTDSAGNRPDGTQVTARDYSLPTYSLSNQACRGRGNGTYSWPIELAAARDTAQGLYTVPIVVGQQSGNFVSLDLEVWVQPSTAQVAEVAIQTSNGHYLSAKNGGGVFGPDAVDTGATQIGPNEKFILIPQPNNRYAIATLTGYYLTAMQGGGLATGDVFHTDGRKVQDWELYTITLQADGRYTIQTFKGLYLTAVGAGGMTGSGALHTDARQALEYERFRLVPIQAP